MISSLIDYSESFNLKERLYISCKDLSLGVIETSVEGRFSFTIYNQIYYVLSCVCFALALGVMHEVGQMLALSLIFFRLLFSSSCKRIMHMYLLWKY